MDERERRRQRFNRDFAHWEAELPADAMSPGRIWFIVQRGLTIADSVVPDSARGVRERADFALLPEVRSHGCAFPNDDDGAAAEAWRRIALGGLG